MGAEELEAGEAGEVGEAGGAAIVAGGAAIVAGGTEWDEGSAAEVGSRFLLSPTGQGQAAAAAAAGGSAAAAVGREEGSPDAAAASGEQHQAAAGSEAQPDWLERLQDWFDRCPSISPPAPAPSSPSRSLELLSSATDPGFWGEGTFWEPAARSLGTPGRLLEVEGGSDEVLLLTSEVVAGPPQELSREMRGRNAFQSSAESGSEAAKAMEEQRGYFSSLIGVGEPPLIHLVMRYHQALLAHGLRREAEDIAAAAAKLIGQTQRGAAQGEEEISEEEMKGMGLILKDGIRKYLMAIHPALPPMPSKVVKFSNVSVTCNVNPIPPTIKNFANVSFLALKNLLCSPQKRTKNALTDVSGYFMPGTLTLVLGPIGCGKSTLQEVLAGRLKATTGSILYNLDCLSSIRPHRVAGVGFQTDAHLPALTVRETLHFARVLSNMLDRTWFKKAEGVAFLRDAVASGEDPLLESRMMILGLRKRAGQRVGSPELSADERHRLTAAELMVGAYPVIFIDQISHTVDGPASYEIVAMLREYARIRQIAVVCTLLWPSQEVLSLFDRLLLLNRGRVVFQGPRADAQRHFESTGYFKPSHMSLPEFLQQVTTGTGGDYLAEGRPEKSLEEFEDAYKSSIYYQDVSRVVNHPRFLQSVWVYVSPGAAAGAETEEAAAAAEGAGMAGVAGAGTNAVGEEERAAAAAAGGGGAGTVRAWRVSSSSAAADDEKMKFETSRRVASAASILGVTFEIQETSRAAFARNLSATDATSSQWVSLGDWSPNCERQTDGAGSSESRSVLNGDEPQRQQHESHVKRNCGEASSSKKQQTQRNEQREERSVQRVMVRMRGEWQARHGVDTSGELRDGDVVVAVARRGAALQFADWAGGELTAADMLQMLWGEGCGGGGGGGKAGDAVTDVARIQLEREADLAPQVRGIYADQLGHDFVLPFSREYCLLLRRQSMVMWRDRFVLLARLAQVLIMSLFNAFNTFSLASPADYSLTDLNLRRAVFFTTVVTMMLSNIGQLPGVLADREVFYKHAQAKFFRPITFLLAHVTAGLPYTLAEAIIWSVITYFITGLASSPFGWRFFVFFFSVLLLTLNGSAMVRFIAFLAPSPPYASTLAGLFFAPFLLLFAHFLIPKALIPPYWIWAYWISPAQWAATAIIGNEFRSEKYGKLCSQAPQLFFCSEYPNEAIGVAYLQAYSWTAEEWAVFLAWAITLLWILLWTFWAYLCLQPSYFRNLQPKPLALLRGGAEEDSSRGTGGDAGRPEDLEADVDLEASDLNGIGARKDANVRQASASQEQNGTTEKRYALATSSGVASDTNGTTSANPLLFSRGFCLPLQRMLLSWHNLTYEIATPGIETTQTILNDVSGWAQPGQVLAIVGARGVGKTSLLNSLAGRKVVGRTKGQILVNGQTRQLPSFLRMSGYVERGELYQPFLTLRESLEYRASFGLQGDIDARLQELYVEETLHLMQIEPFANFLVGDLVKSTGGKEMEKRIVVAMELAANPPILFLDIPFVGMDMHQIQTFSSLLRHIARNCNRTVLLTGNLPTAYQLNCFNRCFILKRGGECVYFGPTGQFGSAIIDFFASIPGTPRAPLHMSPVSFVQNIIGDGLAEKKAARDYAFEYRVSALALQNGRFLQEIRRSRRGSKGQKEVTLEDHNLETDKKTDERRSSRPSIVLPGVVDFPNSSYFRRLLEVNKSVQLYYWRNTRYTYQRWLHATFFGLLLGTLFFQIERQTVLGSTARAAFIFAALVFGATVHGGSAAGLLGQLRSFFDRERASKQYYPSMYLIAFTLVEIPYLIVSTLTFIGIASSMAGIAVSSASQFFYFWFSHFLTALGVTYLGLLLSVVLPHHKLAAVIIPMIVGMWISTAGYIVPYSRMNGFYKIFFWTNPMQYALNSMTTAAFYCNTSSPSCSVLPGSSDFAHCLCDRLRDSKDDFVWNTIKQQRSLRSATTGLDWLFLLIFCVACRVCTYLGLKFLHRGKKKSSSL